METATVGRIVDLNKYRERPTQCAMCLMYRKAIREYLKDYTSRNVSQESVALMRLRAVLGE